MSYDTLRNNSTRPRGGSPRRITGVFRVASGSLVAASNGLFMYDAPSNSFRQLNNLGVSMGRINKILQIDGRPDVILAAENGMFSYDVLADRARLVSQGPVDPVHDLFDLGGGRGVLVAMGEGVFHYDPSSSRFALLGGPTTGRVLNFQPLPSQSVLIAAERGWFRYVHSSLSTVEAGRSVGERINTFMKPDRSNFALIGTENTLLITPDHLFDNARIETQTDLSRIFSSPNHIELRINFSHVCAPSSGFLSLSLKTFHNSAERATVDIRRIQSGQHYHNSAILAASVILDRPGSWAMQLQQGGIPIGRRIEFTVSEAAPTPKIFSILPTAGVIYASIFGVLIFACRWSTLAFRLLHEGVVGAAMRWPLLLLRYSPHIQQWMLEPWFVSQKRLLALDVNSEEGQYLDPKIIRSDDSATLGRLLLQNLKTKNRLWLQGPSGMGKSCVFGAWEREYFRPGRRSTLASAVRTHGFILVPLRVRDYANLTAPESDRPESWTVEALRRHFEAAGYAGIDRGLVAAMVRTRRFAVAFDGMNEADRNIEFCSFAKQFRHAKIIATSQSAPPEASNDEGETWERWRLPISIRELQSDLLIRWMGEERGRILVARLGVSGLSEHLLSGYDLRLVADLASPQREKIELPNSRIALYRAILDRAANVHGSSINFDELKRLAWALLLKGRHKVNLDDQRILGAETVSALSREGVRVLHRRGADFEFRHEQMRDFLAALWISEAFPTAFSVQQELEEQKAFRMMQKDQEEFWRFYAQLLNSDEQLIALWRWATTKPDERPYLITALQEEADRRAITLTRRPRR
ncbi:NACHT domain-containing protein [Falsiroseomonas oryzae]|uniref:hypothetical protein n=1 Tax=Falsiroseomonas oryzae TaxID=2766473 RepID=UPI0022EAA26B|nr:hypothetical protein [Roseomonas sp. MO-31]